MPAIESRSLLEDFQAGAIEPAAFPHRSHVEVGYELLGRHAFPEALLLLARGLRLLAAKAGKPEVYHETITAAFLALIGERRLARSFASFDHFARGNADLFRKEILQELYEPALLRSELARRTFVLPIAPGRVGLGDSS